MEGRGPLPLSLCCSQFMLMLALLQGSSGTHIRVTGTTARQPGTRAHAAALRVSSCETMPLGTGLFIGLEPAMGTVSSASKPSAWGLFAAEGCECLGSSLCAQPAWLSRLLLFLPRLGPSLVPSVHLCDHFHFCVSPSLPRDGQMGLEEIEGLFSALEISLWAKSCFQESSISRVGVRHRLPCRVLGCQPPGRVGGQV